MLMTNDVINQVTRMSDACIHYHLLIVFLLFYGKLLISSCTVYYMILLCLSVCVCACECAYVIYECVYTCVNISFVTFQNRNGYGQS